MCYRCGRVEHIFTECSQLLDISLIYQPLRVHTSRTTTIFRPSSAVHATWTTVFELLTLPTTSEDADAFITELIITVPLPAETVSAIIIWTVGATLPSRRTSRLQASFLCVASASGAMGHHIVYNTRPHSLTDRSSRLSVSRAPAT